MALLFKNNATSTLASTLDELDSSLTLAAGGGAKFPVIAGGDTFLITIEDTSGNIEVCLCTARTDDTLTITRAQEGTVARDFASGSRVEQRVTAGILNAFVQTAVGNTEYADSAIYSVDGVTSEAVINYEDGSPAVAVRDDGYGVDVYSSVSSIDDYPAVRLKDSTGTIVGGMARVSGSMRFYALPNGLPITIAASDDAGAAKHILVGDPDSDTKIYHNGIIRLKTTTYGAVVQGASPAGGAYNTILTGQQGDGTTDIFRVGFDSSSDMVVSSKINNARVIINSRDNLGTQRDMITASPRTTDTYGVRLHWNGTVKLDTLTTGIAVYGKASLSEAPTSADHATRKDYVDATAASAAQAAVTAGTGLASSKAINGYTTLPGGLILQWGTVVLGASTPSVLVTLPIAFPVACRNVTVTRQLTAAASSTDAYYEGAQIVSASQIRIYSSQPTTNTTFFWQAIGY